MDQKLKFQFSASRLTVLHFSLLVCLQGTSALAQGNPAVTNPCEIPFTKMIDKRQGQATPFQIRDAVNTNPRILDVDHQLYNYKNRFLVVNLDTKNENKQCKGLVEDYPLVNQANPPVDLFPELKSPQTIQHFLDEVQPFYQTPARKRSVVKLNGRDYCIGQTVSLCEIRGNKVVEVARLGTSSLNANSAPVRSRTYGEYNKITHRSWMSDRSYTVGDGQRDEALGGVDSSKTKGIRYTRYVWGGNMILNNFLKWDGMDGFEVPNFYGGLHELSIGETNVNNLGAPVSHGCLRLSKYGSIFARWWTPLGAKLFVHYTENGYRQKP